LKQVNQMYVLCSYQILKMSDKSYQVVKCCKKAMSSPFMEMEDDQRSDLLRMDARQMYEFEHCRQDVATFVISYPTLDVSQELVKGDYTARTLIVLQVSLS